MKTRSLYAREFRATKRRDVRRLVFVSNREPARSRAYQTPYGDVNMSSDIGRLSLPLFFFPMIHLCKRPSRVHFGVGIVGRVEAPSLGNGGGSRGFRRKYTSGPYPSPPPPLPLLPRSSLLSSVDEPRLSRTRRYIWPSSYIP